jgi:DNA topoisomerase-2
LLYHPDDDELLRHVEDDGDLVEPEHYIPILPMILVNGCTAGIGTGWSSSVPSFDPLDLIAGIKVWLDNDGKVIEKEGDTCVSLLPEMKPWYREWSGTIESKGGKFISHGRIVRKGTKKIVEELPIGMWTDTFRDKLEGWKETKQIGSYKNYCTPKVVKFEIVERKDGFSCNETNMKLTSSLSVSNMVMFTPEGLRKFNSVDEILDYYCGVRFNFYVKRKAHMLAKLEAEMTMLGNKKRFMEEVIAGKIKVFKRTEAKKKVARPTSELVEDLEERKYDKVLKKAKKDEEDEEKEESKDHGYNYLLSMQIRSITAEKIKKLANDVASAIERHDELAGTEEKDLWLDDLDEFERAYKSWLRVMAKEKVPKGRKKKR